MTDSLRKAGMSIGDYAEALLKSNKPVVTESRKTTTVYEPKAPDLSKVKIEESDINKIIGKSFGIKPKEKTPNELIAEFTEVVKRGKQIIEEMTSCGMLGVGPATTFKSAPKKKSKKKGGYRDVINKIRK